MDAERFPSGQRGQTVNLLAMPSEVRILPSPPGPPVDHRRNQFKTVVHCPIVAAKSDKDERVVVRYKFRGGSSSVGRASAFQAEGRGFDPRFPLHEFKIVLVSG